MVIALPARVAQPLRALLESPAAVVLGAALYGIWAAAVNLDAGGAAALRIGAFHAAASLLLTFAGSAAMRRCFAAPGRPAWRIARAFGGGMGLTYGVLFALHGTLGTPHVLLALAAGVLPTTAFCAGYALLLARTEDRPC